MEAFSCLASFGRRVVQGLFHTEVTTFRAVVRLNIKFIVVCFLLGDSPASEIYMPTFRNTLFHLHRYLPAYEDGTDRVFRNVGI